MQLNQAKSKTNNNISVLDDLAFVIIMGNFYQFPSIIKRFL